MKKESNWKKWLSHCLANFYQELIKTSVIGKKLLTASRTNAHLKETYEELGRLLESGIESGEVKWESAKVQSLLHIIKACKSDLEDLERQVHKIKFSSGPKCPQDLSHYQQDRRIHPDRRVDLEEKK